MHSHIRIVCRKCNARIRAPIQLLGQVRACPQCKRRLVVQTRVPNDALPMLAPGEPPAGHASCP
jgi:hypothetical protein